MAFEWDEQKREINWLKHGVDFPDVLPMFDGDVLEIVDERFDYGEERFYCLGEVEGRVYAVAYTWRGGSRRILSARKSNDRETRRYYALTAEQARTMKGKTDHLRLDATTDADIARAVADDPDAAPLDIDWSKARLVIPPGKELISLRVDGDMLDWFKQQGRGYQTRMNAVLRAFYEAMNRVPPGQN